MAGSSSGERASRGDQEGGPEQKLGTVFWTTIAIATVFVLAGVLFTEPFAAALTYAADAVTSGFGWVYLLMTTFFLAFVLYLAFSRYGRIKLGAPDEEPEFGRFAWFAMLFQAGMGIGLVFWGVSEPILHYNDPPHDQAAAGTPEAANLAIQYAFFHWTLQPWAIYALVGLAVAYFSYRRGMKSLRVSAVFRPVLGDRVDGPVGKAIDILAITATLVGIAASLGQGTLQIDAGLGSVFGTPTGISTQLIIIAVTAVAYMLSASTPIEKGVNFLSQASIYLAALLLIFFVFVGPSLLELNALTQGIGNYVYNLVPMSLNISAFDPDPWLGDWTIYFWATWIAWAPYVGVFIARISRGRTIREFVLGVLLAPSAFSMVWFAVLGASSINLDQRLGGAIGEAAASNEALALFEFLNGYPLALLTSLLAIFLVWIFFVAGADAGTIVLGSMSTGGALNPRRSIKLIWGAIMALVAAVLLIPAGGIATIQEAQILIAAPFAIVMGLMAWALYRAIRVDYREERAELQKIMGYDEKMNDDQMEEVMKMRRKGRPVARSTEGKE